MNLDSIYKRTAKLLADAKGQQEQQKDYNDLVVFYDAATRQPLPGYEALAERAVVRLPAKGTLARFIFPEVNDLSDPTAEPTMIERRFWLPGKQL